MIENNQVINFEDKILKSSLILSSPHSGVYYPDDFFSLLKTDVSELKQIEDSLVDELISGNLDKKNLILKAVWSRSVVDVNRAKNDFNYNDFEPPIEHISSKPTKYSRSGIGVIPIKCGMGESIYNTKLSGELAKKWLDVAWTTYHQTLIELLQKAHKNFGHYILFDFHSMPSTSENLNNKIDIVLGDCHGKSIHPKCIDFFENELSKQGLKVRRNSPYSGGYITEFYGKPKEKKHAIQIEINRSIYLNEKTRQKNSNFENCKLKLNTAINNFEKNKHNLLN